MIETNFKKAKFEPHGTSKLRQIRNSRESGPNAAKSEQMHSRRWQPAAEWLSDSRTFVGVRSHLEKIYI